MYVVRLLALSASLMPLVAQETPDARARSREARDLADQGSAAIPRLQTMLSDPDREVRVQVVKSLVDIGTQYSLDPLVGATRDNDPEIQIRATDGLVNFYLPGYVRTGLSASLRRAGGSLKARFTDTNDQIVPRYVEVRPEVIAALGKLARGGSSMDSRANAARALGILRGQAALPDLIEALRSKNDRVLYEGLIAIQKIRDPSAAPRIAFLLRDLNEKVRIAAIETTGLLRNAEALPQLRAALKAGRSARVRRAALTAIAMIPDPSNREVFIPYLNDKDAELRAGAAEGIGRLKNTADLPRMQKMFNEEKKKPAQLAAAFAAVMLGDITISDFSPLQFLVNTLNSSAWRGVARPYLIEAARDLPVRRTIEQSLKGGTRDEKVEISQVLAVSGDRDSLPFLDALSKDGDTDVATAAINASRILKTRLP